MDAYDALPESPASRDPKFGWGFGKDRWPKDAYDALPTPKLLRDPSMESVLKIERLRETDPKKAELEAKKLCAMLTR